VASDSVGSKYVTTDSILIKNATNGVKIDSNNGVLLSGTATCWDDIRVAGTALRAGTTAPTLGAFGPSGSLRALLFESGKHQEAHVEIQMPHNWKLGSRIYPHVHWTPTNATAGNVVWELEYAWKGVDSVFGAPSNMASDAAASSGTAWKHTLTKLKEGGNDYIDGTGRGLSSMIVCRLHRNAGAGSDNLSADVALLEFDIHYEVDGFGSKTETAK
jgi:hypothetical protein